MKKQLLPLMFVLALAFALTQTTAAFPGMTYSGDANTTNIRASLDILAIPLGNLGASADVTIGTAQSDAVGSVAELMAAAGGTVAGNVAGAVEGESIDEPIASVTSLQSYLSPSGNNPDTDGTTTVNINEPLLSIGSVNNQTSSVLLDSAGEPNLVNPTNSRSDNHNEVLNVNVGLPLLIPTVISADTAVATTTVYTSDASDVVTQGYDSISCESESVIEELNVLGLISADLIRTTTTATVDGQTGNADATVEIVNLVVGGIGGDPINLVLNETEPIRFNLLGGDIILTVAPVLEESAEAELASAEAVALQVQVLANVLGIGAGTVVEIGAADVTCATVRGNWNPTDDTDGDGIIDLIDLDDDDDGLSDLFEGDMALDTDGDRIPDSRDLDSDNDGANDVLEAGHADVDLNRDGQIDGAVGDNGLSNLVEDGVDSGTLNYTPRDSDSDGIPDVRDLDSDNDSILDVVENGFADQDTDDDGMLEGADDDFDGIFTAADALVAYGDAGDAPQADADSDGIPNSRDLDSDNDGTPDLVENGHAALDTDDDAIANGSDGDDDGVVAVVDTRPAIYGVMGNTAAVDTDNDGIPDAYDLDSDNDGITDVEEAGLEALDPNGIGTLVGSDDDFDGIVVVCDGLPTNYGTTSNGDLPDADNDGNPDMQETDSNDDGTNDIDENGVGTDNDGDGEADGGDDDGDGIPESADNAPDRFGLNGRAPTAVALSSTSVQATHAFALTMLLTLLLALGTAAVLRD